MRHTRGVTVGAVLVRISVNFHQTQLSNSIIKPKCFGVRYAKAVWRFFFIPVPNLKPYHDLGFVSRVSGSPGPVFLSPA